MRRHSFRSLKRYGLRWYHNHVMNYKKRIFWFICTSLLIFGVSFPLLYNTNLPESVGLFPGLFGPAMLIPLIVLYFIPEPVFHAWKKFALVSIPISMVITILSPSQREGSIFGPSFFSSDKESTIWMMASLFVLISLILIIRKAIIVHRSKQTNSPFPTSQTK